MSAPQPQRTGATLKPLIALFCLPMPFTALADSAESDTADRHRLQPVVVTSVAPQSPLTVETDPSLPRQPVPASDAADYLKTIPGFSAIRSGGTNGDPVLRGQFGSRINLLTDGGAMIGACPYRMDAPSSYISPENYDRLKVIKGPETVQWGPMGSAGTILFEHDPLYFDKPASHIDASVLGGSNGRFDRRIDASAGNPDGYLRLQGNRAQADDYKDGNGDPVPSRWEKWNGDLYAGWTPNRDSLVELHAGRGNGDARYGGRGMDGAQFERDSLGLRFRFADLGDVFEKAEGRVYYNYADHVMDNYSLRTPSGTGMMAGPMASNVDRRTLGGRLQGTWMWQRAELIAGLDGQRSGHRERDAMGEHAYHDVPWTSDAEFQQYGVFGELTWHFNGHSRLIGGARLDRHDVKDERETIDTGMSGMAMPNPSAGQTRGDTLPSGFLRYEHDLAHHPVTWYAGVGHAERFPDYWELFSPSEGPDGSANAFAAIRPEKTTQLDIGTQYRGKTVDAWVSAYAGYVRDFILFHYHAGMMGDTTQVTNVDATLLGGEAGASWRFAPGWKADLSLSYTHGRNDTENRPLPQIPPLESRLGLSYRHGAWSASGLWRLVAAQHRIALDEGNVVGQDLGDSDGFGVFSLNAAYRLSKHFKISAGVDNLFDRTYAEHLNLAGDAGFGYPADTPINEPGRTLWVKLDARF